MCDTSEFWDSLLNLTPHAVVLLNEMGGEVRRWEASKASCARVVSTASEISDGWSKSLYPVAPCQEFKAEVIGLPETRSKTPIFVSMLVGNVIRQYPELWPGAVLGAGNATRDANGVIIGCSSFYLYKDVDA